MSASVPCRCSHIRHYEDRKGRVICSHAACGCAEYRPSIPARMDERYDPSPEPIDRSIQ